MTPWRPTLRSPINIVNDGMRTVFMPLRYLYPECMVLIDKDPQLYPLQCLRTSCPKNKNCMEVLANRVKYFFDNVTPGAGMIVAYYKWKDRPNIIRAGIFEAHLPEPRQITCRTSVFKRYQREGEKYSWDPPTDFYLMGGSSQIIPAEGLIKS